MADEDGEYSAELDIKHERFRALGGGETIQMDLKKLGLERAPLAKQITDAHRQLVFDLTAQGLSNEDVAEILGISKERVQSLFEHEIKTGFQIAQATVGRSLYLQAVAGDRGAATDWLRYHNRSKWATKQQSLDKDGVAINATEAAAKASDVIQALIRGMSTDKGMRRVAPAEESKEDKAPVVSSKKVPVPRTGSIMRKSKREVDDYE